MKNIKIARCEQCHQVVVLNEKEEAPLCCGKQMTILKVQDNEALEDTHLPVINRKDGRLFAYTGAYDHPMEPDHYIEWMALQSEKDTRICYFHPGETPSVPLKPGEGVIAVYSYCNQHGLWKTEI